MVNYIRISEAAEQLNVTRAGMYHIIETLGLPTVKIMGITAIDAALLTSEAVVNRRTNKPTSSKNEDSSLLTTVK